MESYNSDASAHVSLGRKGTRGCLLFKLARRGRGLAGDVSSHQVLGASRGEGYRARLVGRHGTEVVPYGYTGALTNGCRCS